MPYISEKQYAEFLAIQKWSEKNLGPNWNDSTLPNSPNFDQLRMTKTDINFRKGWHPDVTQSAGPRWSIGRGGKMDEKVKWVEVGKNCRQKTGGKFRETFFSKKALQEYTPGPGAYRKDVEFPERPNKVNPNPEKDEVNTNLTIQEEAPDYSVPKTRRETWLMSTRCDALKPSYLVTIQRDGNIKDSSIKVNSRNYQFTPGPGHYTQYTTFGSRSGGSLTHSY